MSTESPPSNQHIEPVDYVPRKMAAPSQDLFSGRTLALIASVAVLFVFLSFQRRTFLTANTMQTLAPDVSIYLLLGLSQAMCLVIAGMNMSVGAIGSIITVVLGVCLEQAGMRVLYAVPIALVGGSIAGWVNGLLITRCKIDSFIVTLCMGFIYKGMASGISRGSPYDLAHSQSLFWAGQGTIYGIPYIFIIVLVILVISSFVYRDTVFGRHLLATGGNADAARLSGINTNAMIVWANILSGLLAGLCAILYASYSRSATPGTGDTWVLDSFAVAIIGGTGLTGGVVSPLGILMGACVYKLIRYGMVAMAVNDNYANCFIGILIFMSIIVDRIREIYSNRRR